MTQDAAIETRLGDLAGVYLRLRIRQCLAEQGVQPELLPGLRAALELVRARGVELRRSFVATTWAIDDAIRRHPEYAAHGDWLASAATATEQRIAEMLAHRDGHRGPDATAPTHDDQDPS